MRISDWSSDVCSSDLLYRVDRVTGDRAEQVVRVDPRIREQLDRFKAMGNRDGVHSLQGIGQIAVEREARELSSVAADILEAPSGIRCMSVVGRTRCLDQWVSPASPRKHGRETCGERGGQ